MSGTPLEIIPAAPAVQEPLCRIATHFDLEDVWTTEQLLADGAMPGGTLVIQGIEDLSIAAQGVWSNFLGEVVHETKVLGRAPTRFVAILSPQVPPPANDTHVAILNWWGRLSHGDVEGAILSEARGIRPDSTTELLWFECLAKAFALTRPDLVPVLAEIAPHTIDEIRDLLSGTIGLSAVGSEFLFDYDPGLVPTFTAPPAPATPASHAWDCGLLDWTVSQGVVWMGDGPTPAKGNLSWIDQALARGQRDTLLPVVERVRAAIDRWIAASFGPEWDKGLAYSTGDYETERREGILGLFNLARELDNSGRSVPRAAFDVMHKWKRIRNELAHNSSVTYDQLDEAVSHYSRFRRAFMEQ